MQVIKTDLIAYAGNSQAGLQGMKNLNVFAYGNPMRANRCEVLLSGKENPSGRDRKRSNPERFRRDGITR